QQAVDEPAHRKTQYSAQTGRIIPPSSQASGRRPPRAHFRSPRPQGPTSPPALHDQELMILQTDSLSRVQQWLTLAGQRGLRRTAMAAIGQEIAHIRKGGQVILPDWASQMNWSVPCETRIEDERKNRPTTQREEDLAYVRQGQEALQRALEIVENQTGWKIETLEVESIPDITVPDSALNVLLQKNGDVIYSKVLPGSRKVFRLEAVLDASPEELHNHLFVKAEEMNQWNPNIKQIKVLKHIGRDTMVTHEVSAETAGNLIGQRDFLSVRHSYKQKSCFYLAGKAIHLESFPPQNEFVRAEDGPTCIIIQPAGDNTGRSQFTWLLNMDLKRCHEHRQSSPGICVIIWQNRCRLRGIDELLLRNLQMCVKNSPPRSSGQLAA
ncbi:hypothetical protein JZ751_007757, partial [Albula glossodonta]